MLIMLTVPLHVGFETLKPINYVKHIMQDEASEDVAHTPLFVNGAAVFRIEDRPLIRQKETLHIFTCTL